MRVIVALSGGKASAWCAGWAFRHYPKQDVVLYFNDTHWEHPDLYRFLSDLEQHFQHPITRDSDGRSPEQVFRDHHAIANNRMPFCSRVLKAERLQKFYQDGDALVFGISADEPQRADRLLGIYQQLAVKTGKYPVLHFPLITEHVTRNSIDTWLSSNSLTEPILYRLGFTHNNCSGGCVRAGRGHWRHLLKTLPAVYADRERAETEFQHHFNKPNATILKGISLKHLRELIEANPQLDLFDDAENAQIADECFGICNSMN